MGNADGEAAVEALCILAKRFLASGQTSQAVKCLEAVCRSSAPMPLPAAKTRLWLAQVLLQHTQNISEATHHLQKAVSANTCMCTGTTHPGLVIDLFCTAAISVEECACLPISEV